jgi:hypothetical protein
MIPFHEIAAEETETLTPPLQRGVAQPFDILRVRERVMHFAVQSIERCELEWLRCTVPMKRCIRLTAERELGTATHIT